MTDATAAERALFCDLTRLFMTLRQATHEELEARLEERFRQYVRSRAEREIGGLQITFTLALPEGADGWSAYTTEYRTLPAQPPLPHRRAVGGPAEVLAFPSMAQPASVAARPRGSAQIIAFPRP